MIEWLRGLSNLYYKEMQRLSGICKYLYVSLTINSIFFSVKEIRNKNLEPSQVFYQIESCKWQDICVSQRVIPALRWFFYSQKYCSVKFPLFKQFPLFNSWTAVMNSTIVETTLKNKFLKWQRIFLAASVVSMSPTERKEEATDHLLMAFLLFWGRGGEENRALPRGYKRSLKY